MSDDEPLAVCCRLLADSQEIIAAKNAEIELLRGYRDEAESQAAIASLAADKLRLTDAEREAVNEARQFYSAVVEDERCQAIAEALRKMLERLGGNGDGEPFTV